MAKSNGKGTPCESCGRDVTLEEGFLVAVNQDSGRWEFQCLTCDDGFWDVAVAGFLDRPAFWLEHLEQKCWFKFPEFKNLMDRIGLGAN